MRRVIKVCSSLALVLLLVFSLTAAVFAASPSITFHGFSEGFTLKPGSEYTKTDLFGGFKGVMPGDVLTEEITFTNAAVDCDFVRLYMRAQVHNSENNPLSDGVAREESLETMTEFLSVLSMKVWNGSTLIFDASPSESGNLSSNQFLGVFRSGETATLKVELAVPLELDNRFSNRVGEVDWVFHVEAYNESQLSVRKVWSDGNAAHAQERITVNLLKDGQVERTAELSAENGWAYTFDRLLEGYTWTVAEAEVPEGYTVSYEATGTSVTITNTRNTPTPPPDEPLDVTVKKVWSNDKEADRPGSVTVTLYNGNTVYDTVTLSGENNWTYHWKDLSVSGNWQIVETNIPNGYTPSYHVSGSVTTITNTWELIYTGQLNWPVLVLGGVGIALVMLGGAMLLGKKKRNHA